MNINQEAKGNNNIQIAIQNFQPNNISSTIATILPNIAKIYCKNCIQYRRCRK